ncbi:hypothetical protein D9619_006898 [Psilocybe cf. subviscida]|uniref:Uncharacterized protein n=1 Tax=Psilocybe cf. subviscida TaxID=2480587 RepID=A0A8H5EXP4_9AGAR|nr:hypothetical protein D9619_006898 [Psilocybe cf. subviscida]
MERSEGKGVDLYGSSSHRTMLLMLQLLPAPIEPSSFNGFHVLAVSQLLDVLDEPSTSIDDANNMPSFMPEELSVNPPADTSSSSASTSSFCKDHMAVLGISSTVSRAR